MKCEFAVLLAAIGKKTKFLLKNFNNVSECIIGLHFRIKKHDYCSVHIFF